MVKKAGSQKQRQQQSPIIEYCDLDSTIMARRVGRIITRGITGKEMNEILSHLKRQKYSLVYWQAHEDESGELPAELSWRGEKFGSNISYVQRIDESFLNRNPSMITSSTDGVSLEDLEQLVRVCTRCSHLSQDPRIDQDHVFALFNRWLVDGMGNLHNRDIMFINQNGQCAGFTVYTVEKKLLHVNLFAIAVADQQRGNGTKLMHALLDDANRKGCTSVSIVTQENNVASKCFYERVGMNVHDRYDLYHFWL